MKKKGLKFQVTVPVVIFRLLGIIYFVTSVLLSLFFFVRCRGVQTDLQMFCICLFFIGVLFFFANHIWHVDGYYLIPCPEYDTVELQEIDLYEYEQLKALGGKTPEAIIDAYTLSLIQGGLL